MSEGEPNIIGKSEESSIPRKVLPPIIDPESGLFEDEDGRWGGNKYFGEADIQYLTKRKNKVRNIGGFGVNKNRATLYHLEDAQNVLQERNLDVAPNENGIYSDGSEQWGNRKYFGYSDYAYLESAGANSLQGIGGSRKPSTFFNINEAQKILQERNNLPQVDNETGIFVDESGEWGTKKYFGDSDSAYLKSRGDKVRIKSGRAGNGNIATLFNVGDGKKVLQERDNLPQVDVETGLVVDETGQWGGRKIFKPNEIEYLKKRRDVVRYRQGRVNGSVAFLFNLEDAKKVLEERDSLPQVEPENGIFEDENGRWGTKKYFGAIDTNYLRNRIKVLRTKAGRSGNGDFATLYNIEDAERILEERDRNKTLVVSPDKADEMMRGLEVLP